MIYIKYILAQFTSKVTWSFLHGSACSAPVRPAAAQTGLIPIGIQLTGPKLLIPYRTWKTAWTRLDHFHSSAGMQWSDPAKSSQVQRLTLGGLRQAWLTQDVTFWVRQTWLSSLPLQERKNFSAKARDKPPAIYTRNLVRLQVLCTKPPYLLSNVPNPPQVDMQWSATTFAISN